MSADVQLATPLSQVIRSTRPHSAATAMHDVTNSGATIHRGLAMEEPRSTLWKTRPLRAWPLSLFATASATSEPVRHMGNGHRRTVRPKCSNALRPISVEENACPVHHKDIELIDATGSSGVVKAQFSPGKPALRVGPATFRAHIEMPSGSGRQHHLQHVGQRHPMGLRTSLMIDEWRTMPGQAPIAGATARPQVRYLHAAFVVQTSLQPSIPSRRA